MSYASLGFGGGCHWCTEAVFEAVVGVVNVEQGWITSFCEEANDFSEAVVVSYENIDVEELIYIHLLTHHATASHSMRKKYRSAIYVGNPQDRDEIAKILKRLQKRFPKELVTKVYPLLAFKKNKEEYLHYFLNNPDRPFCQTHILPKLQLLQKRGIKLKSSFLQLLDRSAK